MKNYIFYMTGTGNSLWVSREIALRIREADIFNIGNYSEKLGEEVESIGLVFPSYFNSIPDTFATFIRNLEIPKNSYIYAICTHNGNPGDSIEETKRILKLRGLELNYGVYILMPGNGLLFGDNTTEKEEKQRRLKASIDNISNVIKDLRNRTHKIDGSRFTPFQKNRAYEAKKFLIEDNDILNKFYSNSDCTGCGLCSRICSFNNITMENRKPKWGSSCSLCLGCIHYCPSSSINIEGHTESIKRRYKNPFIKIKERIDY